MNNKKQYIKKSDFHTGEEFTKINKHIDTCLTLIEKLISCNAEYKAIVDGNLKIPYEYVDYRRDQFDHYDNTLRAIYYSCFSLKYIYEISTFMNFKEIDNTIGNTLENQRKAITFNAIIQLSSIFEALRKEYEMTIEGKGYFKNMKAKYPLQTGSLILLKDFRNTVHNDEKWNNKEELIYELRKGKQVIKKGNKIVYDIWKLYRIIKESLELHKFLALDNKAKKLRDTKMVINGQRLVVVETEMTLQDWEKLFENRT